jgi:hypothetical protein
MPVLFRPVLVWVNNCLVVVALVTCFILYFVMDFPRLCCAALRDNKTKQYAALSSLSPPESEVSSVALPTSGAQYTVRYKVDPLCNEFLASEIFSGLPLEVVNHIRDFVGPRRISLTDGRYRTLYEGYRNCPCLITRINDDSTWCISAWLSRKNVDGQIINHNMMIFSWTNVHVIPHEQNIMFTFWNDKQSFYDPNSSVRYRIR